MKQHVRFNVFETSRPREAGCQCDHHDATRADRLFSPLFFTVSLRLPCMPVEIKLFEQHIITNIKFITQN